MEERTNETSLYFYNGISIQQHKVFPLLKKKKAGKKFLTFMAEGGNKREKNHHHIPAYLTDLESCDWKLRVKLFCKL